MSTLETVINKAKTIYPVKGKKVKAVLEDVFGKETFIAKITERVQTVECAYSELKINRDDYLPIKSKLMSDERYEQLCAETDWEIVVIALNEGVELSYANKSQKKWKIWLKHDGVSGFRFYHSYYAYDDTNSFVCSRLDFATQELAEHAAKYFLPLINKIANK